ncbi:MAG: DUF2971 domain-containing protein [Gammaproteobacteria bacterium]
MDEKPYEPPSFTAHLNVAVPGALYHYTGQAGLLGIVHGGELWATKIQYMNDATEFGLALNLARQHLKNIIEFSRHPGEKAAGVRLEESLHGIEDINIFAACFCEKGDSLSQWRGYAGGNHGYAIGFDPDALMQIADRVSFVLGPCIYDVAVQKRIVEEIVGHCLLSELNLTATKRWGFHGPLADILFRYGVFFKDGSFADENEWRLVSATVAYDDDRVRFRSGKSMVTPFLCTATCARGRTADYACRCRAMPSYGFVEISGYSAAHEPWKERTIARPADSFCIGHSISGLVSGLNAGSKRNRRDLVGYRKRLRRHRNRFDFWWWDQLVLTKEIARRSQGPS